MIRNGWGLAEAGEAYYSGIMTTNYLKGKSQLPKRRIDLHEIGLRQWKMSHIILI
jgi:hypothetical protein